MSEGGPKPELRDGETIRAYLEELVRMKAPVQLWKDASAAPFETTLQAVSPITFSTTTIYKVLRQWDVPDETLAALESVDLDAE